MAKQITFKPKSYDPAIDVQAKLQRAPTEHAAAILSLYELLQEAENHGVLDLLRGSLHAGDEITSKLAEYANTPLGITAIRNLLVLGKVLGTLDPEVLNRGVDDLTVNLDREMDGYGKRPPSAWGTMKRAFSGDALRGLSLMVTILASVGKTLNGIKRK